MLIIGVSFSSAAVGIDGLWVLFKIILGGFMNNKLVQVGSVLPRTSAVYFHHWCVIVDCDGPNLVLCSAFSLGVWEGCCRFSGADS